MFPFLVAMYVRLARREEAEARQLFGEEYIRYETHVPGWFPHLRGSEEGRTRA